MAASTGVDHCYLHVFSQNGDKCWFESLLFTCSENMKASAGLDQCCLHEFSKRGDKCWFEFLLFTYVRQHGG